MWFYGKGCRDRSLKRPSDRSGRGSARRVSASRCRVEAGVVSETRGAARFTARLIRPGAAEWAPAVLAVDGLKPRASRLIAFCDLVCVQLAPAASERGPTCLRDRRRALLAPPSRAASALLLGQSSPARFAGSQTTLASLSRENGAGCGSNALPRSLYGFTLAPIRVASPSLVANDNRCKA